MSLEAYGETGAKVLVTAENLFAAHGYHGVSLRQITAQAGVNLAAVNYHYQDKESLYLEVLAYRLRHLNEDRRRQLDAAEMAAGRSPVPLRQLADVLARPLLLPAGPHAHGAAGCRLLGRALIEPLAFTAPTLARDHQPTLTRWGQAVRRHAPALPPPAFLWQLSFVVGALHHAAAAMHDMKALTNGICRNDDAAGALENFCEFAAAAFAPRTSARS